MFRGYLTFDGVEIANSARTRAYANGLGMHMGLLDRGNDAGLGDLLRHEPYDSPALDGAPWYSPARPDSDDFYGFHVLDVQGLEDLSPAPSFLELDNDGAALIGRRLASRTARVSGVLVGRNERGVESGLSWLKGVLSRQSCDECTGTSMGFLGYMPTYCDYSDRSQWPPTPLNYVPSTNLAGWTGYLGGSVAAKSGATRVTMPEGGAGAQFFFKGMIPGEHYRLTMSAKGTARTRMEVPGGGFLVRKAEMAASQYPTTPWVLDFVAPESDATVRLTLEDDGAATATLDVASMTVTRLRGREVVSQPNIWRENFPERPSWVPVTVASSLTPLASWPADDTEDGLTFTWANDTGSAANILTDSRFQRPLFSLRPGWKYKGCVKIDNPDSLDLRIDILNTPYAYTDIGGGWHSVEFEATDPVHHLNVRILSDEAVSDGDERSVTVRHMRVDRIFSSQAFPEPDQITPALREARSATLSSGPTVIQEMAPSRGAMKRVEFFVTLADPNIYAAPQAIDVAPDAASYLIAQQECARGYPKRTNMFSNPYFVGTNGDPADCGVLTVQTVADTASLTNEYLDGAMLLTPTGVGDPGSVVIPTEPTAFLAGHTYTVSADVRPVSPITETLGMMSIRAVVDGQTSYRSNSAHNSSLFPTRVSVTFTPTVDQDVYMQFTHGGASGDGPVEFSNVLVEEAISARGVFGPGDDGVVDNTTYSEWSNPPAKTITDPDATQVPDTPAIPSITVSDPHDVTEWRQYGFEIPAALIGGQRDSFPVITLTTQTYAVKHVRMTFLDDPLDLGMRELNQCDYQGKFFIDYIPPHTTMTIDTASRTVIANVRESGETNASNLVSNGLGGPAVWPVLTGDVDHYMMVDVVPTYLESVKIGLEIVRRI